MSITAISYATGLLTLIQFKPATAISSNDVNLNFQSINDQLAAMAVTISSVQAAASLDASNKATAAQTAAVTQVAQLYQPKFGATGWIDVTSSRTSGVIYQNGNTPRFVLILHSFGASIFSSAKTTIVNGNTLTLSNAVVTGGDQSSNNNTWTVSGSYVVPPNYFYTIEASINNWFEYNL